MTEAQVSQIENWIGRESQRDSVPKPRVAKNELPWVCVLEILPTPTGLISMRAGFPG